MKNSMTTQAGRGGGDVGEAHPGVHRGPGHELRGARPPELEPTQRQHPRRSVIDAFAGFGARTARSLSESRRKAKATGH